MYAISRRISNMEDIEVLAKEETEEAVKSIQTESIASEK